MTIVLEPVDDQLPIDFHQLELDARAGGHANMTRLSAEFAEAPSMFHRVIAAHVDGTDHRGRSAARASRRDRDRDRPRGQR